MTISSISNIFQYIIKWFSNTFQFMDLCSYKGVYRTSKI